MVGIESLASGPFLLSGGWCSRPAWWKGVVEAEDLRIESLLLSELSGKEGSKWARIRVDGQFECG